MKKLMKMMKKGDIIIIGLLIILSFLPLALINRQKQQVEQDEVPVDYAVIRVDGEELYRMELVADGQSESYQYENAAGQQNLIKREGTEVYMAEANCADGLCIQQGKISQHGETVICLPHRLLVEVLSVNGNPAESEVDLVS